MCDAREVATLPPCSSIVLPAVIFKTDTRPPEVWTEGGRCDVAARSVPWAQEEFSASSSSAKVSSMIWGVVGVAKWYGEMLGAESLPQMN